MLSAKPAEPEDLECGLAQAGTGSRWGRDVMQTWYENIAYVPWVVVEGENRVAFAWVCEMTYDEGQLFTPLIHPAYWWDEVVPVLLAGIARWARRHHLLRLRTTVRQEDGPWRMLLEEGHYRPVAEFQVWWGAAVSVEKQPSPAGSFSAAGARQSSGGLGYVQGLWRRWQMSDIYQSLVETRALDLGQGVYLPWWLDGRGRALTSSWAQFGDDPVWPTPVLYKSVRRLQALANETGSEALRLVLPAALGDERQLPDCLPTGEIAIWQVEVS